MYIEHLINVNKSFNISHEYGKFSSIYATIIWYSKNVPNVSI